MSVGVWAAESQPAFELKDPQAEILKYSLPKESGEESSQAIVVLPSSYRSANSQPASGPAESEGLERRYPVIYLLHGYGGDHTHWYRHLVEAGVAPSKLANQCGAILVMPDGKKSSWYLDVPKDVPDAAKWQWETAITKYLVPEVDLKYRTLAEPAARGIIGMSMGGHGALYLAARHPDLFGVCVSLSGAVDLSRLANKYELAGRLGSFNENRDRYVENSAITQAETLAGKNVKILIDCGSEDPFIEENRELSKKLKKLKIEHEYVERSGGHEWKYWTDNLPYSLKFMTSYLKPMGWAPVMNPDDFFKFRTIVVDQNLPDDPYGLDLTDLNNDDKYDIVVIRHFGVDWYEGPTWKKHSIVFDHPTKMNSYGSMFDVDHDGWRDLVISADFDLNNTKSGGSLWWARNPGGDPNKEWKVTHIADEPTLHRVRWCDTNGDGKFELMAQPVKGRDTTPPYFDERGSRLMMFTIPDNPLADPWPMEVLDDQLHVTHAILPVQFDNESGAELLVTSFEGVHLFSRTKKGWKKTKLCEGEQETDPSRGAGEVTMGRMAGGQKRYLATIEPWHGNEVVVYQETADPKALWSRKVIDDSFDQGHAIGAGELDGDEVDEIVAGYRGPNKEGRPPASLKAYKLLDYDTNKWQVQWIDVGGMATEDLRVIDLNQDGMYDIVAIGRSTRNVKVYMNTGHR